MRIPTAKSKGKVVDRGMPCIFVGYDPNRKGYRILPPDGKVQTAVYQDVVFLTLNSSNNEVATPQVTIAVSSAGVSATGVSSGKSCENDSSGIDENSFVTADDSDSEQEGEPSGDPATPGGLPNSTPGNIELAASIAAPLIDHLTPELGKKFFCSKQQLSQAFSATHQKKRCSWKARPTLPQDTLPPAHPGLNANLFSATIWIHCQYPQIPSSHDKKWSLA